MSDMDTIMKNLKKGKQVESNLAMFANSMMTNASRLAQIRFTLNFPVLYESMLEEEAAANLPAPLQQVITEIFRLAWRLVEEPFSGAGMEEEVQRTDRLRSEMIGQMKLLTALSDRFTLCEYVMNRVEYRFREGNLPQGYGDEELKERLMAYLTSDSDRTAMQLKTVRVLEQLPMRMSKGRFFQILEDGLSVYRGSEKKTVEEVLYMIRTGAMLSEEEDLDVSYSSLQEISRQVFQTDWKQADASLFDALHQKMQKGFGQLNVYTDLLMLSQELVNDLYVIFLSRPYAMADLEEKKTCETIIKEICLAFQASAGPLSSEFFQKFSRLEGVQERCSAALEEANAQLEEIQDKYKQLLPGLMLDKIYASLSLMEKLFSNSLFVELNGQKEETMAETADEVYIAQVYGDLAGELKALLRQLPRNVGRAVMAKVLTFLPLFVTNRQEVEAYIEESLASCSDQAEKTACVEILETMMKDDKEMA